MGTINKNSNRVTGKSVTLVYNNLNKDAIDFLSTGTFFSTINLPGDTVVTGHKVLEKTDNSLTIYIRLNKKVGFNINYFTLHSNNMDYVPIKKHSLTSSKKLTPLKTKHHKSKYDYNYYRCIKLLLDGSPLYYPKEDGTNPSKITKVDLNSILMEMGLCYNWKESLKHLSIHVEDKNIVVSFEYVVGVRYTSPPTQSIPTHKGYLKVLSYDLNAKPEECVNNALKNNGVVNYSFSEYDEDSYIRRLFP